MTKSELLAIARGDQPAETLLRGARLVNVLSGDVHEADLALAGGVVIGWGDYTAHEVIDLAGAWVAPGLLDAHVHIESSLLSVGEFARAVAVRGTTGAFVDPHEVANVCGLPGLEYVLAAAAAVPLDLWVNVPSCVPASPMDDPGAVLDAAAVADLLGRPGVLGLAEMMNFPGTIAGDPEILAKLAAAGSRPIDGHAPGIRGRQIMAYSLAGPESDHECTSPEEALERVRAGCYLFVREGSATRNLAALLAVLTPANARRLCFCCDDIQSADLLRDGHLDRIVRLAIGLGVDPVVAVQMATLNTAERFRVADRVGSLAPGRQADLVILDDLTTFQVRETWKAGRRIATAGAALFEAPAVSDAPLRETVRLRPLTAETFRLPWDGGPVKVIEVYPSLILTGQQTALPRLVDGQIVSDPDRDLLLAACLERHRSSGLVGLGLVTGFGLQRGALASTVGHDSHNITVVGVTDRAMRRAVEAIVNVGGGLAVATDDELLALLPLPLAGLMSDQPVATVAAGCEALHAAAQALGTTLPDPFMTLSFISLSVIPALRLTPRGLVDVGQFRLVPLGA
ncbi:MAG: adenine deaminase [Fimbriimonadaceae bacterium]|nr:adenine deaminase [Fimbriimonadaceae bacterium]